MHITVDRSVLQEHLELVGKVSTKHVTLPVLQCVLCTVADGVLTLRATNLEIGIETTIPVKEDVSGVVAIPTQTILQTIQLSNQKEVTIELKDTTVVVTAGASETHINTIPYEEFPTLPKIEGTGQEVQKDLFALGIRSTAFAASQSSIKPELGSIYILQKKEQTLTFVTTDSFRLMEKTVPQKGFILSDTILVPYKNALEFARICDASKENPTFLVNDNQCALAFPSGVYITSRLTSGSFPDYEQIIPKEYCTDVTLLKQDLVHALKKTNIFLNKFMQVSFAIEANECKVSAQSGEVGTTTESIPAQVEGDELSLSFNQRYLHEPLNHINDESILMQFAGIGRPMVITGVHDSTLRYLVMPMNK